ncbi:MAG: DNA polymerase III subunit alpha [Brockia lithotrophica]|nr:DNA polymerase III subunit alpha [Brockia lithotrophica]
MSFVHLHVHSSYSLHAALPTPEAIVEAAHRLGMPAVALTDRDALFGAVKFLRRAEELGVKPILGLELTLVPPERLRRHAPKAHLTFLALNAEGYGKLLRLATAARTKGKASGVTWRDVEDELADGAEGLVLLSGDASGEIPQLLRLGFEEEAYARALAYIALFGRENVYVELMDHGSKDERLVLRPLRELAEKLGLRRVVTHDVRYLDPQDARALDVLMALGAGVRLNDPKRPRLEPEGEYAFFSREEMERRYAFDREALEETLRLAERVESYLTFGELKLPDYPLPLGMNAQTYLRIRAREGAERRYGSPLPAHVRERLEYELRTIQAMGFQDYFLIVWDVVRAARERGIPVGPGRGSAAGSLVAYALGITDVDPLAHDLLFERFLNPERRNLPDIDIDVADVRRDEVLRYLAERFGRDRVAQIVTFGTIAARQAVRDAGRLLGIPPSEVDRIAKLIPAGADMTLAKAQEGEPALREILTSRDEYRRLAQVAARLEGLPRQTSVHAAGVVIAPEPLRTYVPLMDGDATLLLTQYPMEDLEAIGLLKMDFLGLRNLTIVDEAVRLLAREGREVRPEAFPKDDPATFELLARGDTAGVFQLESRGMRAVLRRLLPERFEDLVAVLALYRPGPMAQIDDYIAGKRGEREVRYPHAALEPILRPTYGVLVYQEQIMRIAEAMAGYTLGEADVLRRGVAKKERATLERERERFVERAVARGFPREVAEEVYELIVRFADYGFNKSHAVAYAELAYRMAYLKANHPREFFTALLSQSLGAQDKVALYVSECRRRGIPVYLPDVNRSEAGFAVEGEGIRFGLRAIRGVGDGAASEILRARAAGGEFRSLSDFLRRTDRRSVSRRSVEALIRAGALDSLPGERAAKLRILDLLLKEEEGGERLIEVEVEFPDVPPLTPEERLRDEREFLGTYVSGHPADTREEVFRLLDVLPLRELEKAGGGVVRVGGELEGFTVRPARRGGSYAEALLTDFSGAAKIVAAGEAFDALRRLYADRRSSSGFFLVVVEGTLAEDEGEELPRLWVRQIVSADGSPEEVHARLFSGRASPSRAPRSARSAPASRVPRQPRPVPAAPEAPPVPGPRAEAAPAPPAPVASARSSEVGRDSRETSSEGNAASAERRLYVRLGKAHKVTHVADAFRELLLRHSGDVPVFVYDEERRSWLKLPPHYHVRPTLTFLREARRLLGEDAVVLRERGTEGESGSAGSEKGGNA